MAAKKNPGALAGATGAASRSSTGPYAAHVAHRHNARQKPALGAQETSDAWAAIVARPAPGWRVIVCRDGLQWILQRRKQGGAERPWRAVGYCRTRTALLRLCASFCGLLEPKTVATLAALPAQFANGHTP